MATARELLPDCATRAASWFGVRRVLLLASVAILALWAGEWGPTAQTSHANARLEPSGVGTTVAKARFPRDDHRRGSQSILVVARIVQLTAEKARLEAEREGAAEVEFPPGFMASDPRAVAAAARERRLFESRRAGIERQKALLGQRIAQVRHEIDGLLVQQRARENEIEIIRQELRLLEQMHGRQLANLARLMTVRRDLARAEGDLGAHTAQVARVRAQVKEIELQIVEIEHKAAHDAQKEIRDIDARLDDLSEREPRGEDRPAHVEPPQQGAGSARLHERQRKGSARPSGARS